MQKRTRGEFEEWAKDQHWFCYQEVANPNGRQFDFVTPTGNIVAAVYSLDGLVAGIVPMTSIQVPMQGGQFPGLGPRLGKG